MVLLAVYGTLRRGFYAHGLLLRNGAEFVCKGVVKGYRMYIVWWDTFPIAVWTGDESDAIVVEVYNLPDDAIEVFDDYEGPIYAREPVVVNGCNGKSINAQMYVYKPIAYEEGLFEALGYEHVKCGDYYEHVFGLCNCEKR